MPFSTEFLFSFVPFDEEFYVQSLVYQISYGSNSPAYPVAGFKFGVKIPYIFHSRDQKFKIGDKKVEYELSSWIKVVIDIV